MIGVGSGSWGSDVELSVGIPGIDGSSRMIGGVRISTGVSVIGASVMIGIGAIGSVMMIGAGVVSMLGVVTRASVGGMISGSVSTGGA